MKVLRTVKRYGRRAQWTVHRRSELALVAIKVDHHKFGSGAT